MPKMCMKAASLVWSNRNRMLCCEENAVMGLAREDYQGLVCLDKFGRRLRLKIESMRFCRTRRTVGSTRQMGVAILVDADSRYQTNPRLRRL